MTRDPRVYLAGPEVFLPEPLAAGQRKKAICAAHGLAGVFPLDSELDLAGLSPEAAGLAIYRANRALMDGCDLLIANLTPYRGPSADAGTIFELGYMRGLGRPVFGYSNVAANFAERTRDWIGEAGAERDAAGRALRDADGMAVEDFGLSDNLMIDGALLELMDELVCREVPPERRYTDPAAFEACVAIAARKLAGG